MNLSTSAVMPMGIVCICFLFCVSIIQKVNAEITVQPLYGPTGMLTSVDFYNDLELVNEEDWNRLNKSLKGTVYLFKNSQKASKEQELSLVQQYFDLLFRWIPCDSTGEENTFSHWTNEVGYPNWLKTNFPIELDQFPNFEIFLQMSANVNLLLKEHGMIVQSIYDEAVTMPKATNLSLKLHLNYFTDENKRKLWDKILESTFELFLARLDLVVRTLNTTTTYLPGIFTNEGLARISGWKYQVKQRNVIVDNSLNLAIKPVKPFKVDTSKVIIETQIPKLDFLTLILLDLPYLVTSLEKLTLNFKLFTLETLCTHILVAGFNFVKNVHPVVSSLLSSTTIEKMVLQQNDQMRLLLITFLYNFPELQVALMADCVFDLLDKHLRSKVSNHGLSVPLSRLFNPFFYACQFEFDSEEKVLQTLTTTIVPSVNPMKEIQPSEIEQESVKLTLLRNDVSARENYNKILEAARNVKFRRNSVKIVSVVSLLHSIRLQILGCILMQVPFDDAIDQYTRAELTFPLKSDPNEMVEYARTNYLAILEAMFPSRSIVKCLSEKPVWKVNFFYDTETANGGITFKWKEAFKLGPKLNKPDDAPNSVKIILSSFFRSKQIDFLLGWSVGERTLSQSISLIFQALFQLLYKLKKTQFRNQMETAEWYFLSTVRSFSILIGNPENPQGQTLYSHEIDTVKAIQLLLSGRLSPEVEEEINDFCNDNQADAYIIAEKIITIMRLFIESLKIQRHPTIISNPLKPSGVILARPATSYIPLEPSGTTLDIPRIIRNYVPKRLFVFLDPTTVMKMRTSIILQLAINNNMIKSATRRKINGRPYSCESFFIGRVLPV